MIATEVAQFRYEEPDLSFIMPCFNEEAMIRYTIPRLVDTFESAGYQLELLTVDNGSSDRTGELIKELETEYRSVVYHRVEINEGYGKGVLSAIPLCKGPWVGIIPADGQVDAEDVVRLFEAVCASDGNLVGKVRRRFRMDGLKRKIVSVSYNLFVRMLWPGLSSIDLNGSPKILPRALMYKLDLRSKDFLLDPELMIKAHYMGVRVLELNVFARMRSNGLSHVSPSTCWEFFRQLFVFRFSGEMSRWKEEKYQPAPIVSKECSTA